MQIIQFYVLDVIFAIFVWFVSFIYILRFIITFIVQRRWNICSIKNAM